MKTNRLRATMFGLLVAIISLGNVNAETFIVKGKVTDAADGSGIIGCTGHAILLNTLPAIKPPEAVGPGF